MDLWSFGLWGSIPPITDPLGPFVENIEAGPAGLFNPGTPNFTTSGVSCSAFAPGPPMISGMGKAKIGTSDFSCTVSGTSPSIPAVLALGFLNDDYLGLPLPLDLTPLGWSGCFLYQNLTAQFPSLTDATGSSTIPIAVPNDPIFINVTVYLQWLVIDVSAPGLGFSELGTLIIEA